jgi:hypothetical protein
LYGKVGELHLKAASIELDISPDIKNDVFKTKKPGDDTSDEEQEWLNALEKGELDDMGGIKKNRDPLLMTARQVWSLIHS